MEEQKGKVLLLANWHSGHTEWLFILSIGSLFEFKTW